MRFDTNNPNMADQFNYGNSTAAGAMGTYRNGSDVACGLIYDNLNTPVGPAASPGSNTGWIGRGGAYNGSSSYNFKIITFRFGGLNFAGTASNPKVFEFDCDTDRGRGTSGSDLAGMVIRVTFLGGIVYEGALEVDSTSAVPRSATGF